MQPLFTSWRDFEHNLSFLVLESVKNEFLTRFAIDTGCAVYSQKWIHSSYRAPENIGRIFGSCEDLCPVPLIGQKIRQIQGKCKLPMEPDF